MKLFNILLHFIITFLLITTIHSDSTTDSESAEELIQSIQTALKELKVDVNTQKTINKEQFRYIFKRVLGQDNDQDAEEVLEKMTNSFMENSPEEIYLHNITDYFDADKILKSFTGILSELNVNLKDLNLEELLGSDNSQGNDEDSDFSKEMYNLIKGELDKKNSASNEEKQNEEKQNEENQNEEKQNEDL